MTRRRSVLWLTLGVSLLAAATALLPPAHGQTPKRGGVLNAMLSEDPPGFSIHEAATISGIWPVMPCYSNLVLFDPLKPQESADTVIPELAERWSWQDNYRNLVFFLRKNVRWHDGRPFTSKDVKYTFDVVRETADAPAKLRLNPRKEWYANVDKIEAADPHTVIFHLKRPQPSLLLMLASGYSPVYPAHVPLADLRLRCVGTGPFKLKEYLRGQMVEMERNADYFVPGRPYLDGIRYPIITERGTRLAALQADRRIAAARDDPIHGGDSQEGRAVAGRRRDRTERQRQRRAESQARAVRQHRRATRCQLRHRPPCRRAGGSPGRRSRRRRTHAQATRDVGAA
jgi:ABC-type transport system substrate-binding protein